MARAALRAEGMRGVRVIACGSAADKAALYKDTAVQAYQLTDLPAA